MGFKFQTYTFLKVRKLSIFPKFPCCKITSPTLGLNNVPLVIFLLLSIHSYSFQTKEYFKKKGIYQTNGKDTFYFKNQLKEMYVFFNLGADLFKGGYSNNIGLFSRINERNIFFTFEMNQTYLRNYKIEKHDFLILDYIGYDKFVSVDAFLGRCIDINPKNPILTFYYGIGIGEISRRRVLEEDKSAFHIRDHGYDYDYVFEYRHSFQLSYKFETHLKLGEYIGVGLCLQGKYNTLGYSNSIMGGLRAGLTKTKAIGN